MSRVRYSRVVFSTIGAAQDMENEDLRRLYVNSVFWAVGLDSSIPAKADVTYVGGDWKASPFGGKRSAAVSSRRTLPCPEERQMHP